MNTGTLVSQCWCMSKFVDVPEPHVLAGLTVSCGAPWCRPGVVSFMFPLPAPLMSLNDRDHWGVKGRKVKAWRNAAFIAARAARVKPQPRSIVGLVLPVQRLNARRDPSNMSPCTKACVDGMVDARIWPDDTSEFVVTAEPTFKPRGDVVVTIAPIEAPPERPAA